MKIKEKLTLGVGLLFVMIALLALLATAYINVLKNDTENILTANYNTLEYSRNMMLALDESKSDTLAYKKFKDNLNKQQNNITEIGEKEVTQQLADHFNQLKKEPIDSTLHQLIRLDISNIMNLNMEAIQRKSTIAQQTASSANTWIAVAGTICFIIAFTLLLNLPGNIANPIKELSASIKQIAAKDYDQRLHFESHDEFGELAASFNTMAEKLQEYENSNLSNLLIEKKRIETLINNMHDPVIGLDVNKKILFVNNQALKILGTDAENIIGKSAVDISVTNDLLRLLIQDLMTEQIKLQNIKHQPLKIFADNKESYFEKEIVPITIIPTGEKDKKNIGHVIVLKNITPFKELDFAKTNFIATVSHELKTPISSIKMSLSLLEKQQTGIINEDQRQLIESIKDDSNRLLKITGELLNMSQVETGNIQLNLQESSPYKILNYAAEAVKVQVEKKQIDLQVDVAPNLENIKADAEKTAWVLINFLTNAVRYSPEKSKILVQIKKENGNIIFSVKDEGKGIESRYRNKIFDKYFQIPGSNKTGTGLGLAISKEFIEAQNGTIGVESEIGMGSTFYFAFTAIPNSAA